VIDLDAARHDLRAFADAVRHPLAPWQTDSLRLEARTTVLLAARQLGKSLCLALVALHRAYAHAGHRVLIISAGDDASKRVLAEIRDIATRSPLLRGSVVDEQAALVTLSNGSRILSVPASERRIRGERTDTLLIDEASLLDDALITSAALPTTAARPDARIVLAGTALTAAGPFYDLATAGLAGSPHVQTFRWVPDLIDGDCHAPWQSASAIASARESMSTATFDAEYRAIFATGADALISPKQLAAVTADYEPLTLADGGRAGLSGGVDWAGGLSRDRSALVPIGKLLLADRTPRYAVAVCHAWPRDCEPHRAVADIAASPLPWRTLTPEANGLGLPLSQDLVRAMRERPRRLGGGRHGGVFLIRPWRAAGSWESQIAEQAGRGRRQWEDTHLPGVYVRPCTVTPEAKAAALGALRLLIHREQLLIPESAVELRRELLLLKVEITPQGLERVESGGRDLCSALMLATGPHRDRGQWKNLILQLSERASLQPPATVPPELALAPHTTTGAGLRIPIRPAWEAIAGDEITLPPGVVPGAEARAGSTAVRREAEMNSMRDRVRAALTQPQQEASR
jgi:hypothetical protein